MDQVTGKIVVVCRTCRSFFKVDKSLMGRQVTCSRCRRPLTVTEGAQKNPNPVDEEFILFKLALNYGLINEHTLESVLHAYSKLPPNHEKIWVERLLKNPGGLSEDHIHLLEGIRQNWDLRLAEKKFAADAVAARYISGNQARKALADQAQYFYRTRKIKLLMDMFTEAGLMTQDQCRNLLTGPDRIHQVHPHPIREMKKPVTQTVPPVQKPSVPDAVKPDPGKNLAPPDDVHVPTVKPEIRDVVTPVETVLNENISKPRSLREVHVPEQSPDPVPAAEGPAMDNPADPVPDPETAIPEPVPSPDLDAQQTEPGAEPQPEEVQEHDSSPVIHGDPQPDNRIVEDTPPDETHTDENINKTGSKTITINGLELTIDPDALTAMIRIPRDLDTSGITADDIKASLREEDIVYGIVDDALIRGFLNSKVFREKPFKIAEGKPAVQGREGGVTYFFDTDYLKIGEVSESGTIDFKNRGEIPYVTEGTILAEITPAVPGKNGKDIYGRDLLVQDIKPVFLKCEHGAALTDDGRKAVATANGQPKLSFGNRLHVLTEIYIPGDVGYETGHVDFEGNVTIKGGVQNDFHVKGANVTAEEVFAAHIIARGDLVVKTGITGATLDVEGDIKAKFINKSTIRAYGNVVVEKEIQYCDIETSGICSVTRGKIVSSNISAKQGVEAQEIGTEIAIPSHIKIGVDDHINHETELIDALIDEQETTLKNLELKLKELSEQEKDVHKIIAGLAHVQDRSQLEKKNLENHLEQETPSGNPDHIKEIKRRIAELTLTAETADADINTSFDRQDSIESAIRQIREQIWACKDQITGLNHQKQDKLEWAEKITTKAYVKTKGAVYSGTIISGRHCTRTLRETMRAVRIHEAMALDTPEGWEIKIG